MKVVIIKHVPKLGRVGEVKEVADGYARNFLIPQGFAALATPKKLQELLAEDAHRAAAEARERERAKKLAQTLTGMAISLTLPANDEGTLYGAVRADQVAETLRGRGHKVRADQIELPREPIKKVGNYTITIRLGGVETRLGVDIMANRKDKIENRKSTEKI